MIAKPLASPTRPPQNSPFRIPGFRQVFAAAGGSQFGTQISAVAIPLVAVAALHAGPAQVGLLGMLGTAAFLFIGLPAGAWVDQRRRPVMVAADLARAALLGWVPVAWLLGVLTLAQLYVAVALTGVCTVFFDVASQSLLPQLVDEESLTAANSALVSMGAISNVTGRAVGGLLVQALAAPTAIAVDAVSYLWSAAWIRGVDAADPRPASRTQPEGRLRHRDPRGLAVRVRPPDPARDHAGGGDRQPVDPAERHDAAGAVRA